MGALHRCEELIVRKWTCDEYFKMYEMGLFEEQRVELIDGEIIVSAAQSAPQNSSISKVGRAVERVFDAGYWVRTQMALRLNNSSEPEPDISVVSGTEDDYPNHPTSALLVVEVSGTSLRYDRTKKAAIYAQAGIEDYWIINLFGRCLEVYRNPGKNDTGQFVYERIESINELGTLSPLAKPEARIAVAELLPLEKQPSENPAN